MQKQTEKWAHLRYLLPVIRERLLLTKSARIQSRRIHAAAKQPREVALIDSESSPLISWFRLLTFATNLLFSFE